MKKTLYKLSFFVILILLPGAIAAQDKDAAAKAAKNGQNGFGEYFLNKTLRIDYFLAGNNAGEHVFFREIREEPFYGGPHHGLTTLRNTGTYRYSLIDSATGQILFSRGFSSVFQEWKGTPEAKAIPRAFPMVAVMPYPKKKMNFIIEKRSYETGAFEKMYEMMIRPDDYFILRDSIHHLKVEKLQYSGDPSDHVDIAFLSEGYTESEMPKFIEDARSMFNYFMSVEPYSIKRDKFNFYAVMSPSDESGVSIPGKELYVNTNIHSSFYTFDMDRYLTSFDTKSIYDIAANVPYDAIFVLVNSKRYGGGGFYNHYCEGTVDNQYSRIVAVHEFGHSFAGLADEYYNAEVTYSDFYNLKVEPWEPNLTTNVDFASKWKSMVNDSVPVPTPRVNKYKAVTGMFEGGGYLGKGMYSPQMDCRMKSNEAAGFCPVCQKAILDMIRYYSGSEQVNK